METPVLSAAELATIQAGDRKLAKGNHEDGVRETPSPIDVEALPPDDDMTGHLAPEPELCPSPRSPMPVGASSPHGSDASTVPAVITPGPRERSPVLETPDKLAPGPVEREAKRARSGPQPLPCFGGGGLGAPPAFAGLSSRKIDPTQIDADFHSEEEQGMLHLMFLLSPTLQVAALLLGCEPC